MNLDDRARQAASGAREAVAASTMSSPVPGSVPAAWMPRVLAAVGAAAVVVVIAAFTVQIAPNTAPVTQPPDGTIIPDSIVPQTGSSTTVVRTSTTVASDERAEPVVEQAGEQPSSESGNQAVPPLVVDDEPPVITITFPAPGQTFDVEVVRFAGNTEPGSQVFAGRYEADVAADGAWSIVLILSEGLNRAVFVATDAAGNESTADVSVVFEPPTPATTTTTKPKDDEPPATTTTSVVEEVGFSANQVFGSCATEPPFDVFWGTAKPGSKITITSDFGGGSTFANDDGGWEVRVEFPEAPAGDGFVVTVKSEATGQKKLFEFAFLPQG